MAAFPGARITDIKTIAPTVEMPAIPDEVVDDLVVHGSPAQCRAQIDRYFANGVTTSSLAILPLDPELDFWNAVKELSPSAN